ncbi:choline phosphate cytidylyltransferase [Dimargaris xerosporica]|nr:choline phosphate cytidylyltransferase [Dimargaris xerosporica]
MASHAASPTTPGRKPVRIWVDGCFDMMHFGHANALRQAKAMGDYLVVGVHSDAEIEIHKGPTVMKEDERYAAVAACKWVDLVVPNAPYTTSLDVLDQYDCDYCVHGDDITTLADGTDCYQHVKDAGRYKEFKRTQGVSTTELVGRMLLMTKDHHRRQLAHDTDAPSIAGVPKDELNIFRRGLGKTALSTNISHFLPTSKRIIQFSNDREPSPGDTIVYVDGAFDLFHLGHIEFLRRAKALGQYLLVGVHDDPTINAIKGANYPVMNLHERVLSVLQCRYVDEVIIGAPYSVTKDVLEKVYKVDIVAHGKAASPADLDGSDPYQLPKELNIYQEIDHDASDITTTGIITRIINQRQTYEARQARKSAKAILEAEKARLA